MLLLSLLMLIRFVFNELTAGASLFVVTFSRFFSVFALSTFFNFDHLEGLIQQNRSTGQSVDRSSHYNLAVCVCYWAVCVVKYLYEINIRQYLNFHLCALMFYFCSVG